MTERSQLVLETRQTMNDKNSRHPVPTYLRSANFIQLTKPKNSSVFVTTSAELQHALYLQNSTTLPPNLIQEAGINQIHLGRFIDLCSNFRPDLVVPFFSVHRCRLLSREPREQTSIELCLCRRKEPHLAQCFWHPPICTVCSKSRITAIFSLNYFP